MRKFIALPHLCKNVADVAKPFVGGYDDNIIPDLDGVLTSRNAYSTLAGKAADQKVAFEI